MNSWLYHTYQTLSKNKIVSFTVLAIIIAALAFVASKIEFEEDISKLIPSNHKTRELQKVLKTVNFTDKIIVNISLQKNGTVNDLTQYAAQFVDSVQKNTATYIKNIQGIVKDEDIGSTLDFVYENAPLFLDGKDYQAIESKLQKDSIKAITEANYRTLISPSGIITKRTMLKDPLGISFMAMNKLRELGVGDQFVLKDGFLLSADEKNVLLFITPKFGSSETAQNELFAASLYSIQNDLNKEFIDSVESEYFGAALIAVANAQQIKKDIQFTVGIALTVLILIFIVFYRKLTIPLILFAPTIFGGLLSVTLLYLIRGEISAISLGIGSVLLGVTLDYSLHILTHIRNNETIESLYRDISKPILMSSLTTALAFLCLLFLDSQALQDLGIFAAVSVLGASVFALVFIPLVYSGSSNSSGEAKKLTLLDRIAAYDFHKNKVLISVIALLVIVSLFTYNNVIFNNDISKLNYEPPAATKAKKNLDALTNIASKSVYLATYGNNTEIALQQNDELFIKLQKLEEDEEIISFSSIGSLLYSEKLQKVKISRWKQFWNPETIQNTQQNFIESGSVIGFKPSTFNAFYATLEKDFELLVFEDYKVLSSISMDDYITVEDDISTVTTLVKVDVENVPKVMEAFKDVPQTVVIDRQQMNETLLGNLKNDFNSLIGYSLLVVLLILVLFYRSFSLTLVTATPIFLTWFITIGIMGILGIEFNIFNIIISTFIFGLGIDYSIFITSGLLKELQTGEPAVATHKTSVILSVITTILGVGVLIFAKHPALYSISVVSIIGILSAVLMSFTIQPLLFTLFIGSSTKRPITLRLLIHSVLSFMYYGLGGLCLSIFSVTLMKLIPVSKKVKMRSFHKVISKFMKSVLYTNPFVKKKVINNNNEKFNKPGILIANHTSFLDILAVGMLHPKIIYLVNDWVYNSPVFGKAVQLAGFYPVSGGIEKGAEHLKIKVQQGYSLMAFPEGTRSTTNKVRRFHKGAFFLAEQLDLDIIPVLIHGNSEVLPKGSFVIRDGSITVKILERIVSDDTNYGKTYAERTKKVSRYFKKRFSSLRDELEHATYFHSVILNDYRYKGNALFSEVKKDLQLYKINYKTIIDTVGKNSRIINISEGSGQLDFLLLLDSADRRIHTYIEDETTRKIVKHSFITNHYNRITFAESPEETFANPTNTIIANDSQISNIEELITRQPDLEMIVLLRFSEADKIESAKFLDFQIVCGSENLAIFKKNEIS